MRMYAYIHIRDFTLYYTIACEKNILATSHHSLHLAWRLGRPGYSASIHRRGYLLWCALSTYRFTRCKHAVASTVWHLCYAIL